MPDEQPAAIAAFAQVEDLSVRLKRPTPAAGTAEYKQMAAALEDATAELQGIIGQTVSAKDTSYKTRVPAGGVVVLPFNPVREVETVILTETGQEVRFSLEDARQVIVDAPESSSVTIRLRAGYTNVPGELVKWTCVIAAAQLAAASAGNLGLSGGIAGIRHDDTSLTLATREGENGAGVILPQAVQARLRATYGTPFNSLDQRP